MKKIKNKRLPCPFCGNANSLILIESHLPGYSGKICCDYNDGGCGAGSGYGDTKKEAVAKWNQRVDVPVNTTEDKSTDTYPLPDWSNVQNAKEYVVTSNYIDNKGNTIPEFSSTLYHENRPTEKDLISIGDEYKCNVFGDIYVVKGFPRIQQLLKGIRTQHDAVEYADKLDVNGTTIVSSIEDFLASTTKVQIDSVPVSPTKKNPLSMWGELKVCAMTPSILGLDHYVKEHAQLTIQLSGAKEVIAELLSFVEFLHDGEEAARVNFAGLGISNQFSTEHDELHDRSKNLTQLANNFLGNK